MILIDYSAISIGNIVVQKQALDENIIRHMILNSIRMYRTKFKKKFGEVVIVADGGDNWRKKVYPEYKASRKTGREESTIDWDEAFRIIQLVLDELRENFPYRIVHTWGCEADDSIAQIALATRDFGMYEQVMIVSGDKDFAQLQFMPNVHQFSTITKKLIKEKNPRSFLKRHIFKGDGSDGVPNVLSPDDLFVKQAEQKVLIEQLSKGETLTEAEIDIAKGKKVRQTTLSEKRIQEWMPLSDEQLRAAMGEDLYRNYQRNKKMIDLTECPADIVNKILDEYENQDPSANSKKVLNFLIEKRCRTLIQNVGEFIQ